MEFIEEHELKDMSNLELAKKLRLSKLSKESFERVVAELLLRLVDDQEKPNA